MGTRRHNAPVSPFVQIDRNIAPEWRLWLDERINLAADGVDAINGSTGSLTIVAGSNISLIQGASGFTISGSNQTSNLPARISYTQNMPIQEAGVVYVGAINSTGTTAASAAANPFGSSLSLQRIFLPAVMSLTEVDLAFGMAFPATNQGQGSMSQSLVIYRFGNSTSLASYVSTSRAVTWATGTTTSGTSSSLQQGWSGPNIQPFTFAATSLSAGEFAVAHLLSWAAASTSWTISVYGGMPQSSTTASAVTNLVTGTVGAAASFATGSSALTVFTGAPTAANALSSGGLVGVSAFTGTTGAAITAFSGAPATAPVFLTATGTSVALTGVSAHSGSTSTALTAFSGAIVSAPVFATANAANAALLGVSAHSASTSQAVTLFTATPTSAGVLTSAGLSAGSFHSATTSQALTMFTATPTAFNVSGVASTAAMSTTNVSTFTAGSQVVKATATAASVVSFLQNVATGAFAGLSTAGLLGASFHTGTTSAGVLSNSGTAGAAVLLSGGFVAGSFMTASSIAGVISNSVTAGFNVLSSGGLLAGSFLTASGSVGAFTGGTGASSFLSGGGLSAGSFVATSGSVAAISNAGTAGASLAASFTTASFAALTAAATATGTAGYMTTGRASFGYNGSIAMTTNTNQAIYQGGLLSAGIMATGSGPASIDLKSTAVTVTGSMALIQPWFALCGA